MRLILFTNIVCTWASGNTDCKFIKYYEGQIEKAIRICTEQITLMQTDFPDGVRIPVSTTLSVQDIATAINENLAFYLTTGGDKLETRKEPHTVQAGQERVYDRKTNSEVLSTVYKLRTHYVCIKGDRTVARQEYTVEVDQETPSHAEIQNADTNGIEFCNYVSQRFTNLINLVTSGAVPRHVGSASSSNQVNPHTNPFLN